jgi:hypothetical protein
MTAFVPLEERDEYLLKNVPLALLKAIRRDSRERSTSLTNITGEIMAERYELAWEPSTRGHRASLSEDLFCRLPPAVMNAAISESKKREVTIRTVFLDALAEHYDHPVPAEKKVKPLSRAGRPRVYHGRPRGRRKAK